MARWRGRSKRNRPIKGTKTFKVGRRNAMVMGVVGASLALAVFPKMYAWIYEKTPTFNGVT